MIEKMSNTETKTKDTTSTTTTTKTTTSVFNYIRDKFLGSRVNGTQDTNRKTLRSDVKITYVSPVSFRMVFLQRRLPRSNLITKIAKDSAFSIWHPLPIYGPLSTANLSFCSRSHIVPFQTKCFDFMSDTRLDCVFDVYLYSQTESRSSHYIHLTVYCNEPCRTLSLLA